MLQALRRRLNYANVVATLALFLAMGGGAAYAASHYLITSTRQIKPSVLAQLKGKAGAAGAAGAQGAQGAQGPQGAPGGPGTNGTDGKDGANGVSVETAAFAGVKAPCQAGGLEVKSASPTALVCNGKEGKEGKQGKEGEPWTAGGTLPEGKSETGTWSNIFIATAAKQAASQGISFNIPLKEEPAVHFIHGSVANGRGAGDIANGSTTISNISIETGEFTPGATITGAGIPAETTITAVGEHTLTISQEATETHAGDALTAGPPPGCKGEAAKPEADPGNLCVFAQEEGGRATNYLYGGVFPLRVFGSSSYGAIVATGATEAGEVIAAGTWAVTG